MFYSCTLNINPNGINFKTGAIIVIGGVTIDAEGPDLATGIKLGSGLLADDFTIIFSGGALVTFLQGSITYANSQQDRLVILSKETRVLRKANFSIGINEDTTFPPIKLELENGVAPAIILASGKTITFDDTEVILPTGKFSIKAEQEAIAEYKLIDGGEIFLTRGILPVSLIVDGINNIIQGTGTVAGSITFVDSDAILAWILQGDLKNNLDLQGGTLALFSDFKFTSSGNVISDGTISLSGNKFEFSYENPTIANNLIFSGDQATIKFNSDTTITGSLTLSGDITIDCAGHMIDFSTTGQLIVAPGSTVIIKNGILKNISGTRIVCAASTSEIILDDVNLLLNDDYTFAQGNLSCWNKVIISGQDSSYQFTYASSGLFTINKDSSVHLKDSLVFVYSPVSMALDRIVFESDTSELKMTNVTFSASLGVVLSNGKIFINSPYAKNSNMIK